MKDSKNNLSLNLNLLNEKTTFEKLEEALKVSIFGVLYVLLKNQEFSIWMEIIFIILQLLQLMAFPFRLMVNIILLLKFANVWKQTALYSQVSNFLQYFQLVFFFENNSDMYIIAFYLCVCLVVLLLINIIYVSVSFSRNQFNNMWTLNVLRLVISFFSTVMFIPIFELFISIFICNNQSSTPPNRLLQTNTTVIKVNKYAPNIVCWQGSYYVHVGFSILASLIFIIICTIVQMTYFETKSSTHNQSSKSSSKSDVVNLISKIMIVIIFAIFEQTSTQWILIIGVFFLSAIIFMSYQDERPYYSDNIMKAYLVSTGIYFWNCIVLLMGKIFEFSNFNGCLPLFFLGLPILISLILTNFDNKLSLLLINLNKFEKGEKVQKQISYFLQLIDKKDFDRNSKLLLKGYIYMYEESCTLQDCALKKYIYSLENGTDVLAFLLQHTESLYQTGISKFPNCTSLRISYAFFLLERMNKKQQANLELLNTEKYSPKFDEQFIIFRYKKLIEEQSNELNNNDENLDVVSNIAYKNHFSQFKNCISKVATLYMDFWSLLLNPNQDSNEDLAKLNDYGSEINVLVEEINSHFEKMQKLKFNDQEVIRYYADFLNDILNDKEKANHHLSRLNEIENSKQTYDDGNLLNLDLNVLQSSDEYQYVVLSAQSEKFGIINNISLGLCATFGYSRTEMIGKNIEVVMPEIFHKGHRMILQEKINDFKKSNLNIQSIRNYQPVWRTIISFGKNKSRYLVPFNFKVTFVPNNDQNDSFFLAKISNEIFNMGTNHLQQASYILTNNSFIIQNFSANSINILGMNSNAMNNGNMEITRFIKEFREECIKYNIEIEEKSPEYILNMKRQIACKFKNPSIITWTKSDEKNLNKKTEAEYGNTVDNCESDLLNKDSTKMKNDRTKSMMKQSEENMLLTIQDIMFCGKQEGYVFKFEKNLDNINVRGTKDIISAKNITSQESLNDYMTSINIASETKNQISILKTPIGNTYDELNLKIDKSFIPENNWTFQLDPKKMSYTVNPKNMNEIRDTIKEEALKKIRINDEPSEVESSVSESNTDNSVDKNEQFYTESSYELSEKSEVKNNEEYYKINFRDFRFFIYDYKKNSLHEIVEWPKESHMNHKRNEDLKKKELGETKQDSGVINENSTDSEEENLTDGRGKEGILIKQIEYALSKEEKQYTITKMKWISFLVFSVYIGITSLFLVFFLSTLSSIIENVSLIYRSYDILENTINGVYHIRELVLLNNPKYTNIYQPRSDYLKNNTDYILNLFSQSHDLLTQIITTFLVLSPSNDYIINNQTYYTTILQDDLSLKSFNLTLSSSFIETNTALYHVAHSLISNIIPTNKDVFFFLYNSLNEVAIALKSNAQIYLTELSLNSSSFKLLFLYIVIGVVIFSLIAYCLISLAYIEVEKRKESYLEVFFEIGGATIKSSLEKCEHFSKKIQRENISDAVSNMDEAELTQENNAIKNVSNSIKKNSSSKKRKTNNSKEAKVIKFNILFVLLLVNGFFVAIFLTYRSYLGTVEIFSSLFENLCIEQSLYLSLFNTLREYFFDRNSIVNDTIVSSYIDSQLNNIYTRKSQLENVTSQYKVYMPADYTDLYVNILNNNICSYSSDFFDSYLKNVGCTNFLSNSSSYGLNILLANYIEEIRYAKYKFDMILLKSTKMNYNNTLYGYSTWNDVNTDDYIRNDPFQIFNDPSHLNLAILNRYLLRPTYIALKNQLKTSINSSMDTFQTIFITVFSLFLTGNLVTYFFVWRPFENSLNQTIYKTKNMLSIIPKEVLASLSNIHKLLDIGQNYSKAKR